MQYQTEVTSGNAKGTLREHVLGNAFLRPTKSSGTQQKMMRKNINTCSEKISEKTKNKSDCFEK